MSYDTITDEEVLEAVEGSLSAVSMRRPIEAITSRGRVLRRRRRALSGVVAAGALGVSLAVALPVSGASSGQTLNANGRTVNVDMAGWSVHATAHSAVTVTLHQLFSDPTGLQHALQQAGVPAVVRSVAPNSWSTHCPGGPATFELVGQVFTVHAPDKATGDQVFDIDQSAMPAGSLLHIVVYHQNAEQAGAHSLQTLVVTLVNGDPGMCVLPPPMMAHPKVSPVSERK